MDRLGSVDAVTNGSGVEFVGDAHGFDAFGKPRARDWTSSGDKLHPDTDYGKTTEHGFTGHEHLDDTYLIHMNGRVYDYRLGRFLSVDPIISNPADSQSINPYSYIGNNPLSGVDPTGYSADCNSNSFAACATIWFNPPQRTVNLLVVEKNGGATYYPNVPLNTPLSDFLGPADTGKQASSSAAGTQGAGSSSTPDGRLAFNLRPMTPQEAAAVGAGLGWCFKNGLCTAVV